MPTQTKLQNAERELLSLKLDDPMESKILDHWREHEPKKVEALLTKQMLKQALKQKAQALWEMQMDLEKTERLDATLARHEAWNRLMRIEEDAAEEAEAWGMTVEEYLNRA